MKPEVELQTETPIKLNNAYLLFLLGDGVNNKGVLDQVYDGTKSLPVKFQIRFKKARREVDAHWKDVLDARAEYINEHGEDDEETGGKVIKIGTDEHKKYMEMWKDVLMQDVELNTYTIPVSWLGDVEITQNFLDAFEPFLNFDA